MELLQIVPLLPPAFSGIGDYALLLAREMQVGHGMRSSFVSADTAWRSHGHVAPFAAVSVREHTEAGMLRAIEEASPEGSVILLHYVGHGYARRGHPLWLVRALERWRRDHPQGRLLVLFHELYASGPMWSSAFWTLPFQKSLVGRLGRIGDLFLTPTGIAGRVLRASLGDRRRQEIKILPVFSTIGEPVDLPPPAWRQRRMVAFGSRQWRMQAYTQHAGHLLNACQKMEIDCIVDVGPDMGTLPPLPVRVEVRGALPAAEASTLFAHSLAGFFTYPVFVLGKSTIFAAYAAHGMVPVTFAGNAANSEDGLREGEHYLTDDAVLAAPQKISDVAAAASAWYFKHDCRSSAGIISQQIANLVP